MYKNIFLATIIFFVSYSNGNSINQPASYFLTLQQRGNYNVYDVTGLQPGASEQDIKATFLKLAKKWHPDRNKDNPQADLIFKFIRDAQNNYRADNPSSAPVRDAAPYDDDFINLTVGPWDIVHRPEYNLPQEDKTALDNLLFNIQRFTNAKNYNAAYHQMEHRIEKSISFTALFKGLSANDRHEYLVSSLKYIYQKTEDTRLSANQRNLILIGIENLIKKLS